MKDETLEKTSGEFFLAQLKDQLVRPITVHLPSTFVTKAPPESPYKNNFDLIYYNDLDLLLWGSREYDL